MKILATAIVIGPLLVGALPAAAQPASTDASAPPTAGSDATADRNAYLQKAQDEMRDWGQKLHEFGGDAAAKGREGGTAAEQALHAAWVKTRAASRQLGAASADGWESAKASYEKASQQLADSWHKFHSQSK